MPCIGRVMLLLINPIEQSDTCASSHIPHILLNAEVHYRVHNIPLVSILSQLNPFHNLTPLRYISILSLSKPSRPTYHGFSPNYFLCLPHSSTSYHPSPPPPHSYNMSHAWLKSLIMSLDHHKFLFQLCCYC
jgi:hypothetical protein